MKKSARGFTLVELLVVIAIIAVLSVIGITIFTGVQKNARDARRKADVDAITNAMEANYGKTVAGQYSALAASMFAQNAIPNDPVDTVGGATDPATCPKNCKYCVTEGISQQSPAACGTATQKVQAGNPGGATNTYWMICANLENGTPNYYCKGNQQ